MRKYGLLQYDAVLSKAGLIDVVTKPSGSVWIYHNSSLNIKDKSGQEQEFIGAGNPIYFKLVEDDESFDLETICNEARDDWNFANPDNQIPMDLILVQVGGADKLGTGGSGKITQT